MTMQPGTQLGHYQLNSQIGSGGMGDVYLAYDLTLRRKVAIKVLNARLTENKEHWHRFQREARTISGLNHPNILTIHEIGNDSTPYIVTEFIEGKTLRHTLKELKDVVEIVDIAIQICSALVSAHAAGIIHRDIKPENVMLRTDGYVKVLDFGLAKLIGKSPEHPEVEGSPDQSTVTLHTGQRSIVGTISYMSPEQLRGLKLDGRTDIWSLGVVMFEMIVGASPFERPTESDKIAAILEFEPTLSTSLPDIPQELNRIVTKALNKHRDERYQTSRDLLIDLKNFRRELDFQKHAWPLDRRNLAATLSLHYSGPPPIADTCDPGTTRQTFRNRVFWHLPRVKLPILLLCLALLIAGAFSGYYLFAKLQPARKSSDKELQLINLTNTGKSILGVISPDGKYLIHVLEDGEQQVLSIKSVLTGSSATVVPAQQVNYQGITFSNDGEYIYYVRYEQTDVGKLYQTTLFGGTPQKLLDGVDSPIAFSPDGTMMSFVQVNETSGEYALMVASADGSGARAIATRRNRENLSVHGPAWSLDNKRVLCGAGDWMDGYHMNIIEVDLNGTEKVVSANRWFSVRQLIFLNESTIVASASVKAIGPLQLWKISYPAGDVVRLTTDLNDYVSVSRSRDGNSVYSVQNSRSKTIWIVGVDKTDKPQQIASKVGPSYGLAWSPDNRIILSAMAVSDLNISALNLENSETKLLTVNAGDNYHPNVSSDGRYIVFTSNRTGEFNLWRMNSDGSNPVQLTHGGGDFYPYITPDNKWVLYEHQSNGFPSIWKVTIDGGSPVQLTTSYASVPVVSPDGKYIACRYYISNNVKGIAVIPIDGGPPSQLLDIPIINWQRIRWTKDSKSLSYVDMRGQIYNVWIKPLNNAKPKQVTDFSGDQIYSYEWSPDYYRLVLERGSEVSDIVALKNISDKTPE